MLAQTLGGAVFISVAQNVFSNKLLSNLKEVVPGIDPALVIRTGATDLKSIIPPQYYDGTLIAYNAALRSTFYVAVAMAAFSIFGSAAMEWRSVKQIPKSDNGSKITAPAIA